MLARKSLSKYETDLRALPPRLEGDRMLWSFLKAGQWDDVEQLLSRQLEALAVDFLQAYEEEDGSWSLRAEVIRPGVAPPGAFSHELIKRAMESEDALRSEAGYVALPFAPEGVARKLMVPGYWLGQDFFGNIREVTDARLYYGQLEIYRRVAKRSVWVTAAILFAATVIVSLTVATMLARQLSKPILALNEGMKRVAAGKLDEKVNVKASGEVGYLVDSFNRMVQELRHSKEELARAERIAAWQDAARYVAHEIRNPLTPIKISLHRLRSHLDKLDQEEREKVTDSIESILAEVSSLERLATSFSEFAKLPEPTPAPVNINGIIKELVELYRSSGVRMDLKLDPSLPPISADAQQIRMAFLNIVKNAVEAMPEGGVFEISSRRSGGLEAGAAGVKPAGSGELPPGAGEFIEVSFKDTGSGISEDLIGKVGTPHFTTKEGGTGLGLAMVSKVVSQHGGALSIESRKGIGTLVKVILPGQETALE